MSSLYGVRVGEGATAEDHPLFRLWTRNSKTGPSPVRFPASVAMGFESHPTHARSNLERQPAVDERGTMLTFDGRIDNYRDLCQVLDLDEKRTADTHILLAAFDRWGEQCFARLVGDWAIALWSHATRTLYLARDHAGTRCLYFRASHDQILWSSRLEDFIDQRALDQSFAACYLSGSPIRELTPFVGVKAVLPGHFIAFGDKGISTRPHWHAMRRGLISYRTDREYEEHFLSLFEQSIARRSGPGRPILAELSGGMDSSSIVCVSDRIRRRNGATIEELVDTISYYDDSEAGWNERRYFTAVERFRGKAGIHLPLPLLSRGLEPAPVTYAQPGADRAAYENELALAGAVGEKAHRVLLSGIGGDELLGGVPTPFPELADLLFEGRILALGRQQLAWALSLRQPLIHLAAESAAWIIGQYVRRPGEDQMPPWATGKLLYAVRRAHPGPGISQTFSGFRPRSIYRGRTWKAILETLPHLRPRLIVRLEYRYPYLDRDLVEFLLRVPPGQLIRPGQRRSLMRRALEGITPHEILTRPRKGFRFHSVVEPLQNNVPRIKALLAESRAAAMGLVEPGELEEMVPQILAAKDPRWVHALTRWVLFELWCQSPALGKPVDSLRKA
jgi:asparagine synthase (glutamine-hydrolysing)